MTKWTRDGYTYRNADLEAQITKQRSGWNWSIPKLNRSGIRETLKDAKDDAETAPRTLKDW